MLLYGAPEVRFDSFTRAPHVDPPSELAEYHVLKAPVRSSCHASRKSPEPGPAAICGTFESPLEFASVRALHVTPSSDVLVYSRLGP